MLFRYRSRNTETQSRSSDVAYRICGIAARGIMAPWHCGLYPQKHTQHAPSTKTEFDYLYGWVKKQTNNNNNNNNKTVTYAKILPRMVNPRDIAGNAEEEGERELAASARFFDISG